MSRPDFRDFKLVVAGSGFFGGVVAHLAATELNLPVLVLERRSHIGGNSFSEVDSDTGIEYHRYGSHLFHTSNAKVWEFVNRFSAFNNYRHRVFTYHDERMYTMPINLMTINQFFGKSFRPAEAAAFVAAKAAAERVGEPANLEEKAVSQIGRELYEAFVRDYTAKQWETDPKQLPASIISRLPVRFSYNDFYFSDAYEGLPIDGYAKIFERMLDHPKIHIELDADFFAAREALSPEALIVYTGPIDRYYEYRHGMLGWRTLDFEIERPEVPDYQGAAVVNYPGLQYKYTRVHEFKHLHPERIQNANRTLTMREYSRFAQSADEPYYPIGTSADKAKYEQYRELADREKNVIFGGRLGMYKYFDMHQAIAAAMKSFATVIAPRFCLLLLFVLTSGLFASDASITAALKAKLARSKLKGDGLQFQVKQGAVEWSGVVTVAQHKGAATRMAKSAGASSVVNRIVVKGQPKTRQAKTAPREVTVQVPKR